MINRVLVCAAAGVATLSVASFVPRAGLKAGTTDVLKTEASRASASPSSGDWTSYGRDPGGQRFSPLTQITPANVATLTRAWTFDTGATGLQVTPLVVEGVMYVPAGNNIFALEPETGKVKWKFQGTGAVTRRGVAYWPGDAQTGARVYSGDGDGRMIAVDVTTGQLAQDFGSAGVVDLKASVSIDGGSGTFALVSPPAVYRDVVITGGANSEGSPSTGLYGDIRGWDARSGKLLWSFHTVPRPGEPGVETWPENGWKNRSGTNAWGLMTVDVARGLVFAPTGSPTSDFNGSDRHGDNLYGNSLVALDAATGKLKWHRQLVHHDLWDFDAAAPPTLVDVRRRGRTVPSVVQITKMGLLFIFDRTTGEPAFGLEERPVPQTTIPGESTSKTQPFPVKPAPLARLTFDPAKDFYTLTPEHTAYCKDIWEKNRMFFGGPYLPLPTDRTAVQFPSTLGGGNWGGVSYNPALGLVFVNVTHLGQVGRMEARANRDTGVMEYVRTSPWNTPYGRFWNPDSRMPCSAPPFGELIAVNVNTGDVAWRVPLGIIEELEAKGIRKTGSLNLGGSFATASGLVFIGATTDSRFRAFDARHGKELWVTKLETDAKAAPITYMGRDGRQYVVVAAGGGHQLGRAPLGSTIVAFALAVR